MDALASNCVVPLEGIVLDPRSPPGFIFSLIERLIMLKRISLILMVLVAVIFLCDGVASSKPAPETQPLNTIPAWCIVATYPYGQTPFNSTFDFAVYKDAKGVITPTGADPEDWNHVGWSTVPPKTLPYHWVHIVHIKGRPGVGYMYDGSNRCNITIQTRKHVR